MVIKSVENTETLDQIRREKGMPPIDFYKKTLEKMNGIKDHGLL